jgi:hypothetical protein
MSNFFKVFTTQYTDKVCYWRALEPSYLPDTQAKPGNATRTLENQLLGRHSACATRVMFLSGMPKRRLTT